MVMYDEYVSVKNNHEVLEFFFNNKMVQHCNLEGVYLQSKQQLSILDYEVLQFTW